MSDIKNILSEASTIAIVGCSPRSTRTSHRIARYLQKAGFTIVPVNPHCEEILGETCYPNVQQIPADTTVNIVNIFRRPEHTAQMVRDVLKWIEQTGEQPAIWTQLGVSSPEARSLAEDADLPYIHNRCIMVEHSRLA